MMRPDLIKAVALVKGGLSYTEAAARLGLSRNAVAGACNRAGMKFGQEERNRRKREGLARMMSVPATRKAWHAAIRRAWSSPELRARQSEANKRRWAKPGERAQQSEAMRLWHARRRERVGLASVGAET